MDRIVSTFAYILAGCSAFIAVSALGNLIYVAIARWRGSDKGVSFIPFMSLAFAGLACLIGYRQVWLWPLFISLLDPGTWLTFSLPWAIRRMYVEARKEKGKSKSESTHDSPDPE